MKQNISTCPFKTCIAIVIKKCNAMNFFFVNKVSQNIIIRANNIIKTACKHQCKFFYFSIDSY